MTQKKCLIIVGIIMAVALVCSCVYYFFIDGHEIFCRKKLQLVCPEWLEECYKEMEAWYDTMCPRKEGADCKYRRIKTCRYIENWELRTTKTELPFNYSEECRCFDLVCMDGDKNCQKKIHCPSYCMEVGEYYEDKLLENYGKGNQKK